MVVSGSGSLGECDCMAAHHARVDRCLPLVKLLGAGGRGAPNTKPMGTTSPGRALPDVL